MLAESSARADPGAYESLIRDRLLSGFRYSPGWKTIPDDIQSRLASCVAASVVDVFPPEEVRQLDAAMSGGPDADKTLKKLWHKQRVGRGQCANIKERKSRRIHAGPVPSRDQRKGVPGGSVLSVRWM